MVQRCNAVNRDGVVHSVHATYAKLTERKMESLFANRVSPLEMDQAMLYSQAAETP